MCELFFFFKSPMFVLDLRCMFLPHHLPSHSLLFPCTSLLATLWPNKGFFFKAKIVDIHFPVKPV